MAYNLFLRMYTEDDTFNKLRRIPFKELRLKIRSMNGGVIPDQLLEEVMKSAGWEIDDYRKELWKVISNEKHS